MDESIKSQIISAFPTSPIPKGKLSVDTYDDENTHAYFSGTKWNEHDIFKLREHYSAISFFSSEAFRYYIPAYIVAELDNPDLADIIAETIASKIISLSNFEFKNIGFNQEQLIVLVAFFEYCSKLYDDEYFDDFNKAVHKVKLVLNGS